MEKERESVRMCVYLCVLLRERKRGERECVCVGGRVGGGDGMLRRKL